ncbi:MAG: F0F1 ATP synthase subunit C [Thermoplasmatota archaeon]
MSRTIASAAIFGVLLLSALFLVAGSVSAQSVQGCPDDKGCANLAQGNVAIAAGLAVGLAGLGTGLAQAPIGAAAVGAVVEDPSFLGKSILYIAIPETVVIFGVLVAFLLIGHVSL